MAIFNEILSGRYNRALQKTYAIKASAPVRQLGGEILPVHTFFGGVELRAMEEWYRYGEHIPVGAGIAQAAVRLRNPVNSNRIVVLEKFWVMHDGTGGATQVQVETQTTNSDLTSLFPVTANVSWDKRLNAASPIIVSFSNGATALSLARQVFFFPAAGGQADVILEEQQEIILSPGEAIQARYVTNATLGNVAFWWRERKFEPEELNLG